jgi:hypothetical protein
MNLMTGWGGNHPHSQSRKVKVMNVYSEEFLKENEVREKMFKTKTERDVEACQLRKEGWKVNTKKYHFDGEESFSLTAVRRKEQSK